MSLSVAPFRFHSPYSAIYPPFTERHAAQPRRLIITPFAVGCTGLLDGEEFGRTDAKLLSGRELTMMSKRRSLSRRAKQAITSAASAFGRRWPPSRSNIWVAPRCVTSTFFNLYGAAKTSRTQSASNFPGRSSLELSVRFSNKSVSRRLHVDHGN